MVHSCPVKRKEYQKQWYQNNKERKKESVKELYHHKASDPTYQDYRKSLIVKNQNSNMAKTLYAEAKRGAERRGWEFSITVEDIKVPEFCPVFPDIKLQFVSERRADCKPSLDRIDSSKGYIPGNIQVISWKANNIKSNHAAEDLLAVAAFIEKQGM